MKTRTCFEDNLRSYYWKKALSRIHRRHGRGMASWYQQDE